MKKTIAQILFISLFFIGAKANTLSDSLRFSVLTVSPGTELYSVFGHTAIRLTDLKNGHDIVFNYGTFDFKTPNFYLKFALGKLDYQLSVELFDDFLYSAQAENRGVCEQILILEPQNAALLANLLLTNYQPQNRKYRYKFFTDNCATRPRDVIALAYQNPALLTQPQIEYNKTFRRLFTAYLTQMPWAQFGIELVLGKMTDQPAGYNALFLPDNLKIALSKASNNNQPVVASEQVIVDYKKGITHSNWFSPTILAIIILAFSLVLIFFPAPAKYFDNLLFFIFGVLGLFISTMCIFSAHAELQSNFVIAFFLPLVLLVPFLKNKIKEIAGNISLSIILLAFVSLPVLPQSFNLAVLLLSAALAVRLFYNFAFLKVKSIIQKK